MWQANFKKTITFLGKYSVIITLLIAGIAIVSLSSYFFGFKLLRNPLSGSDSYSILSYANFLFNHTSDLPVWYPLQGTGESFILGYPPLYPITLVLLTKLTQMSILQSMSILNFSTVLVTALGAYFFVFFRFKNPIAAIFAGIFLLISPFPFALISGGGFLANAYTNIFTMFTFLFFDAFLCSYLDGLNRKKTYLYLLLGGAFFVLGTLAHPVGTLGIMVLSAVYFPLVGILNYGKEGFFKAITAFFILGFSVFLLSWFWFKPFTDYTNFSNRDITFTADVSTLPPLSLGSVMGVEKNSHELLVNLSVPPVVWIFGLIGSLLAMFKKDKRVAALGVISFLSMFLMGTHTLWYLATKINWLLGSFLVHRYYFTSTIILPPLAGAMGVWYLAELPFFWLKHKTIKVLLLPIVAVCAIALFCLGIVKTTHLSSYYIPDKPWIWPYGEEGYLDTKSLWDRVEPNVIQPCSYPLDHQRHNYRCDNEVAKRNLNIDQLIRFCEKTPGAGAEVICLGGVQGDGPFKPSVQKDYDEFYARCSQKNQQDYTYDLCLAFDTTFQEQILNWPKPIVAGNLTLSNFDTARFVGQDLGQRIDISPSIGSWVKEWNINNNSGLVNAYTGQLVLNKSFNSYFRDILYSDNLVKGTVGVGEITKYFGVNGLIIDPKIDSTQKLDELKWNATPLSPSGITFRQNPEALSLYSLENKNKVLVIGTNANQAYMQVFRLATQGMLSYDNALLFEGKDNIDDYSEGELQKFNLVILHGASYRSKERAYSNLKKYLDAGGNVFIETGWQYSSKDWGREDGKAYEMPEVMPINNVFWNKEEVVNWRTANIDEKLGSNVNPSDFDPLTWNNLAWSLGYADTRDVKEWAKPLLVVDEKVLMAGGNVGKGKIIWTGINLFAHAMQNSNTAEISLLKNALSDLTSPGMNESINNLEVKRTPDLVTIKLDRELKGGEVLYFKENYYPYWRAFIRTGTKLKALDIYNVGPRFMGVIVPPSSIGSEIIFKFSPQSGFVIPVLISLATATFLIFIIITGKQILNFKFKSPSAIKNFKNSFMADENEDY